MFQAARKLVASAEAAAKRRESESSSGGGGGNEAPRSLAQQGDLSFYHDSVRKGWGKLPLVLARLPATVLSCSPSTRLAAPVVFGGDAQKLNLLACERTCE